MATAHYRAVTIDVFEQYNWKANATEEYISKRNFWFHFMQPPTSKVNELRSTHMLSQSNACLAINFDLPKSKPEILIFIP